MIINDVAEIANSDLISGLANISQFYNIYQSTKAANYSQMISELQKQNAHIDGMFDKQTQEILNTLIGRIDKSIGQNDIIIKQNEEILNILRSGTNDVK